MAKQTVPRTMERARLEIIEKAKALQAEKQRIAAEQKAQEVDLTSQSTREPKEKEVVDLKGHIEHLKKIQRDKNLEEQRATALAREKIKEGIKRSTKQAVLEPQEGEPKKQHQEEEENIENIQMDPTPPSPSTPTPASPSSPKSPVPPTSPPAPKSPQQQPSIEETSTQLPSQPQEAAEVPTQGKVTKEVAWGQDRLLVSWTGYWLVFVSVQHTGSLVRDCDWLVSGFLDCDCDWLVSGFLNCDYDCQAIGCKMKSPARGLPRHKTAENGTMFDSKLELQDQTPPTNQLVTRSSSSKVEVKVKAMPGTLECVASNSKQSKKSLKALEYPQLSKFCFSAEELHEEYGLSLKGKLRKELSDKDISDEEWLSVFKCLHKKNTKLFLNHVRDEFVDECRLLYQKVYSATPSNGELLAKFARGFVYERCPAAVSDPIGHRIAWARFGDSILENCKMQKGGLERKINKFRTNYGFTDVIK
ncbi:hypothetical protein L7F22_004401 [Adiantum nelumboides]|nr:hypothetical protein [Adiantum nelumboides]